MQAPVGRNRGVARFEGRESCTKSDGRLLRGTIPSNTLFLICHPLFAEQQPAWGFSRSNCVRWACSSSPGSSFRSSGERRGRPCRRPAGSIGPAAPDESSPRGSRVLTPQFSPGSSPSCPPDGCCVGSWSPGPWARNTERGPHLDRPVRCRCRPRFRPEHGQPVRISETRGRAPSSRPCPRYRRSTELSDPS